MKRIKQVVVLSFALAALAFMITNISKAAYQTGGKNNPKPKPNTTLVPTSSTPAPNAPTVRRYDTKYNHFTEDKAKQAHRELTVAQRCDFCHRNIEVFTNPTPTRKENEALPYHDSCVQCHAEQFTSGKKVGDQYVLEICNGCHNRPFNNNPAVLGFPKAMNQFGMEFSHNTHSRRPNPTGSKKQEFDCAVCHQYYNDKKTARVTFPDHPECNSCHKATNQPAKGECNECHNDKAQAQKFRTRGQIDVAYKLFNFNHGTHLAAPRINNRCDGCHNVVNSDAANGTDLSRITIVYTTKKENAHRSQCFTCHEKDPTEGKWSKCSICHVKDVGTLTPADIEGAKK